MYLIQQCLKVCAYLALPLFVPEYQSNSLQATVL